MKVHILVTLENGSEAESSDEELIEFFYDDPMQVFDKTQWTIIRPKSEVA